MISKKIEYEAIAAEKARTLAQAVGHAVCHGSDGICPTCGHVGLYDLEGLGVSAASIFYSALDDKWRCSGCAFSA
jgi:hypothetical protein